MWNIRPKRQVLSLAGLLFVITGHTQAQSLPLDTAVRTGKLANGFTYYIRHNEQPKSRVVMYLANKVGAMQEDEDQLGLAHFMEHMSFNGTAHFPGNQLVEYLQQVGVRFGADLNAYTSFTETVYQLPLPADDTSIVRNGLQIMRDWASAATLAPTEIDKERGVVLEEKRLRNGPGQRMQEITFPLQVNGSRYANRVPIGSAEVLQHFTPATLTRFYRDWYRPNLQALIVVGDIDVNAIEQQIKRLFNDLKNPVKERARLMYNIPLTGKNQFKVLTDAEQTATQLSVLIKQPGQELKTATDYRNNIIRNLYNYAMGSRLRELALQADPPFIGAQAGMDGFMGGLDGFSVSITPKPGKMGEAFAAVWKEVLRMQQYGITQGEWQRGKTTYLASLDNAWQERNKVPSQSYVKEYLEYFLKGTAAPGMELEYPLTKKLISEITLQEINTYAAQTIKDKDRDIFIYAPEKDKATLPDVATVEGWITQLKQEKLTPWTEPANNEGLLKILPLAGKVIKQERIDSIGVTILTLSNGIKVWIKPTDFKNEEIVFAGFSEGGTSIYPDSLFVDASNAGQLIAANGLGNFTPIALGKLLTGKSVQVQPYIQERYQGISGAATPKDLETALQLTWLYFTAPRKDSGIFRNVINRSKAGMANRANSPEAAFSDTATLVLGMHHYRRQPPMLARMDSIHLDKAYEIYKERFADATGFTFVFTGSIDTATFIPLIAQYIGALPASGKAAHAKDLHIHIPEGQITKTVTKGKDNKAVVRLIYSGAYTFSAANNVQLSALGTILQYRMTDRIRELEGGAYTPQAGVNYGKTPESRYAFTIQFTCAPANAEKLIAAANEEIEKIKGGAIAATDISKFSAAQLRTAELQLRSNQYWESYLVYALQNSEPATGILHTTELLSAVTPQSIQQTAQQYMNGKNYIRLMLTPEVQ